MSFFQLFISNMIIFFYNRRSDLWIFFTIYFIERCIITNGTDVLTKKICIATFWKYIIKIILPGYYMTV